jgi:hypothetical protein
MSDSRPAVKLDFVTGLEKLPARPKMDEQTTQASVVAGRELGFSARAAASRIDGRRLRSRGANTQMNIKVTAAEKEMILAEASEMIQNPASRISNIGEFIVHAVELYRSLKTSG